MALETLKGLKKIDGFEVYEVEEGRPIDQIETAEFVVVDHCQNAISFKIQDGPVGEHGRNGCKVETIIAAAKKILEGLNKKVRCFENRAAILHLSVALEHLEDRTLDREKRGVEGTSQK